MISDDELYRLAIVLGSAAMVLIVLYHFFEVNSREPNALAEKAAEMAARQRAQAMPLNVSSPVGRGYSPPLPSPTSILPSSMQAAPPSLTDMSVLCPLQCTAMIRPLSLPICLSQRRRASVQSCVQPPWYLLWVSG